MMGLPAFKETEEFFAKPAMVGAPGEAIARQARLIERTLMQDRTRSMYLRQQMRNDFAEVAKTGSVALIAGYRAEVVLLIRAVVSLFANGERELLAHKEDLQRIVRGLEGQGNSSSRRFGRKTTERVIKAIDGQISYRRDHLAFIRDDLLPDIDNVLRDLIKQPAGVREIARQQLQQYPVVTEYLAR
jgi:hypothetical protein